MSILKYFWYVPKKKEKYLEYKEKMDKENSHENKNLENLYIDLDSLIVKLSSEKEKYSILNYDTQKFNDSIDNLDTSNINLK